MRYQAIVAALALMLGLWAPADAVTVRLSGPDITTVSCTDGDACDGAPLTGVVAVAGANGSLTVHLGGTGAATPAIGPFDMDLAYNLATTSTATPGVYTIAASVDGLSGSVDKWVALVGGLQSNDSATVYHAFADATNVLFGMGTSLCGDGPSGPAFVVLGCTSGPFASDLFSLTSVVTIQTHQDGVTLVSGDAFLAATASPREVPPIPEPATLLLLGTGLMGVEAWRRYRVRHQRG